MSTAYDFLKECDSFMVLTVNGDYPAGRPFGIVMESGDDLYLATNSGNEAHKQLREHKQMQIVAKKSDSRDWIRITGIASEVKDISIKEKMYEECPKLKKHYDSPSAERFLVFKVSVENVEIK